MYIYSHVCTYRSPSKVYSIIFYLVSYIWHLFISYHSDVHMPRNVLLHPMWHFHFWATFFFIISRSKHKEPTVALVVLRPWKATRKWKLKPSLEGLDESFCKCVFARYRVAEKWRHYPNDTEQGEHVGLLPGPTPSRCYLEYYKTQKRKQAGEQYKILLSRGRHVESTTRLITEVAALSPTNTTSLSILLIFLFHFALRRILFSEYY